MPKQPAHRRNGILQCLAQEASVAPGIHEYQQGRRDQRSLRVEQACTPESTAAAGTLAIHTMQQIESPRVPWRLFGLSQASTVTA